jgi:hypothetical protein
MQIKARLVQLLPLHFGKNKNGAWKKQDIILETDDHFPKKICMTVWGDKINDTLLKKGNMLKIDFDLESREHKGKWYTEVKAWRIQMAEDDMKDTWANILDDNSNDKTLQNSETK